jgi:hypothetical protein
VDFDEHLFLLILTPRAHARAWSVTWNDLPATKVLSVIQQAMLLSPRDPAMSQWHNLRADPELGLGRFDEARSKT